VLHSLAAHTRYLFRKENRVLKRADFLATYEKGKSYRRKAAHVFIVPRDEPGMPTRLGVTVTKKIGGAVQRNRLKRRAREIFRLALPQMNDGFTTIINFHRAALTMSYAAIQRDLYSAWREAGVLPNDTGPMD
jgi:ribonuclease P protein component